MSPSLLTPHSSLLLLLLLTALSACYEPREGCLDVRATNFDFSADDACAECCEYPTLRLRMQHRWADGDSAFALSFDSVYTDGAGNRFRLQRIRYYWSDVALLRPNSDSLTIDDVLELSVWENGDTINRAVRDDFTLITAQRADANVVVGTLQSEGPVVALRTRFGIPEPANRALPSSVPTNHPLAPQLGRMNFGPDTGYVALKIELFRTNSPTDTVPLVLDIFDLSQDELILPFPGLAILPEGFNPVPVIEVNYRQWFSTANVRGDTEQLKAQIVRQLAGSFRVVDVLAE